MALVLRWGTAVRAPSSTGGVALAAVDSRNHIGYGGAGCSSYDLNEYASQLRNLWTDEPLPVAASAPRTVVPGTVPATH
jgi:hypothetical protein